MYGFLLQIIAGIGGMYLTSQLIDGFSFTGNPVELSIAGGILGLLNIFLKPILKVVFLPLRLLTLGLFTFFINAGILWGVDFFVDTLAIHGLKPLILGTILITVLSMALGWFLKSKKSH